MVTLQAGVELKAREAQELGGARLVPMGTLERLNDSLALERSLCFIVDVDGCS